MTRTVKEVFDEIATWTSVPDELKKRGITGVPDCNERCPMAKYILSETDREEVWKIAVDTWVTEFWDKDDNKSFIDNPDNMARFIPQFDQGDYPELGDEDYWSDDEDDWDSWIDAGDEEQDEDEV